MFFHHFCLPFLLFAVGIAAYLIHAVDPLDGLDLDELEKMPLHARIQFAKMFLKNQQQNGKHESARGGGGNEIAPHAPPKCTPDNKFDRCCVQIDFSCPFGVDPDELRRAACKYPPGDLSNLQGICIGYYITKYIKCYSDRQNNRKCCYKAGVPSDCSYWFWDADCGDFCDGTQSHYDAKTGYNCCKWYVDRIAKCNKEGADMGTDTAAVRDKYCQRECTPAWPEYCQNSTELAMPYVSSGSDEVDKTQID